MIIRLIFALSILIFSLAALVAVLKYSPENLYAKSSNEFLPYEFEMVEKGPILYNKQTGELLFFDGKDLYKSWLYDPLHQKWDEVGDVDVSTENNSSEPNTDFTAIQNKVNKLLQKNDYEKAIKLLDGKDLNDDLKHLFGRVYYEYGNFYYQHKTMPSKIKYLKAKACFEKALEYDPEHQNAKLNLEIVKEIIKTLQQVENK